jgi:hypothetical protein
VEGGAVDACTLETVRAELDAVGIVVPDADLPLLVEACWSIRTRAASLYTVESEPFEPATTYSARVYE